jgi:competence protein ComEA
VGKTLAQRIVDFRKEHGPFKRVEDLLKVKGIGQKSLEKIRPYVKVGTKG